MNERFTRIGSAGKHILFFFPDRPFAYVWALNTTYANGYPEWESGNYFETVRKALDFKEPEVLAIEEDNGPIPFASRRDYVATCCEYCNDKCPHHDAFRRVPRSEGGLSLCRNLAD